MSKKIIFRPISRGVEGIVPMPKPAKTFIPDWFKKVPQYQTKNPEITNIGTMNTTMKACMPFLDTFSLGYIQETWCDIYLDITQKNEPSWKFSLSPTPIDRRGDINHYPQINGLSGFEFAWQQQWIPQLPDGYSMLYTHPLNRYDLPFLSLTGVVDNDKYFMEVVANHPFFIQEGFKGIIPKGTPMFQMIPVKRDIWKREQESYSEEMKRQFLQVRTFFTGGYKKLYWQKKEYN